MYIEGLKVIKQDNKLKVGDLVKYKTGIGLNYGFYYKVINDKEIKVTSVLNTFERGCVSKVKIVDIIKR